MLTNVNIYVFKWIVNAYLAGFPLLAYILWIVNACPAVVHDYSHDSWVTS